MAERISPLIGGAEFAQGLVIRYDPGAPVGWHRDRPQFGIVAGLSLSSGVRLRLRRRRSDGGFDRRALHLPQRSLYLLEDEARFIDLANSPLWLNREHVIHAGDGC